MVEDNDHGLDIDGYDLQSRHFGLFEHSGKSSRIVGYVRFVQDSVGPQMKEVWQLSLRYPDLIQNMEFDIQNPFPSMVHLEDNSAFLKAYEKYGKIIEASRLTIHPSVRTLSLASFVIQSITAISSYDPGIKASLFGCKLSHLSYYKRLGCRAIGKTSYKGVPTYLLINSFEHFTDEFKTTVDRIGKAFDKYGEVHYYPKRAGVFSPLLTYVNQGDNRRSHTA